MVSVLVNRSYVNIARLLPEGGSWHPAWQSANGMSIAGGIAGLNRGNTGTTSRGAIVHSRLVADVGEDFGVNMAMLMCRTRNRKNICSRIVCRSGNSANQGLLESRKKI